jgi:hypothetical protein
MRKTWTQSKGRIKDLGLVKIGKSFFIKGLINPKIWFIINKVMNLTSFDWRVYEKT